MGLVNNQKAYDKYLIWPENPHNISIHQQNVGFCFFIRMPNFRGNYLSCIEQLSFSVDGKEIESDKIEFLLNNKRFRLDELPQMYKEYWDVNDCAAIEVIKEGGLTGVHRIGATMRLRYGYSAYFGVCKVVTSKDEKELIFS